jgi:hypothetical protein
MAIIFISHGAENVAIFAGVAGGILRGSVTGLCGAERFGMVGASLAT